jgi:hypothetical protein
LGKREEGLALNPLFCSAIALKSAKMPPLSASPLKFEGNMALCGTFRQEFCDNPQAKNV